MVKIQPYGQWLEIVVTNDIFRHLKKKSFIKRYGDANEKEDNQCAGMFIRNPPLFCIIVLDKGLNINTIAHESYHATVRISEYVGLSQKAHVHEAQAYLNAFINMTVTRTIMAMGYKINS